MNRTTRAYLVRYRREASTALAGLAALLLVNAVTPLHSARILVAVRDLPAGHIVAAGDLRLASSTIVWDGALHDSASVVGRSVARGIEAGEPVTAATVLGPGLLEGRTRGRVAVAVPVDPADAALVRPGDTVDILSTTSRIANAAVVLSASSGGRMSLGSSAASVVIAVFPRESESLAAARGSGTFTLALHGLS